MRVNPIFYPNGETGWEDKKILLEEKPVIRIPRQKWKYTKRTKPGKDRILLFFIFTS